MKIESLNWTPISSKSGGAFAYANVPGGCIIREYNGSAGTAMCFIPEPPQRVSGGTPDTTEHNLCPTFELRWKLFTKIEGNRFNTKKVLQQKWLLGDGGFKWIDVPETENEPDEMPPPLTPKEKFEARQERTDLHPFTCPGFAPECEKRTGGEGKLLYKKVVLNNGSGGGWEYLECPCGKHSQRGKFQLASTETNQTS